MSREYFPGEQLVRVILDDLLTDGQKKLLDLNFGKIFMTAEQRFMNRYKNMWLIDDNFQYAIEKAAIIIERNNHFFEKIAISPGAYLSDQFIWKFDVLFSYGKINYHQDK